MAFISAESLTKYIKAIFSVCLCVTLACYSAHSKQWHLLLHSVLHFFCFYFLNTFCLLLARFYVMLFSAACRMIFPYLSSIAFDRAHFQAGTLYSFGYIRVYLSVHCTAICIESEWVSVCVGNSLWKLKICRYCIEQLSWSVCRK